MSMEFLPVKYRVDFHEETISDEPIYSLNCDMPPISFAVGQFVEPNQWVPQVPPDTYYEITAVSHRCVRIDGSHVCHFLDICVKKVPRPN